MNVLLNLLFIVDDLHVDIVILDLHRRLIQGVGVMQFAGSRDRSLLLTASVDRPIGVVLLLAVRYDLEVVLLALRGLPIVSLVDRLRVPQTPIVVPAIRDALKPAIRFVVDLTLLVHFRQGSLLGRRHHLVLFFYIFRTLAEERGYRLI